jgi:esterase
MYLNTFAASLAPLDMTTTDEFRSLLESASDLNIPHSPDVQYWSRQTVIRGLRFHFLDWGDPEAPPILLLHGGNQSAHSWDLVSLHLADRFHVLALDQRGAGDSEWARDQDYSFETRARDASEFISDQGLSAPVVMGHSMGGYVTMTLALTDPSLAEALVLVDVGPELSQRGVEVIRDFVTHNVEFDDLDQFVDAVARYDRFRSREHIARTLKYNLLCRADGKYASKVDHRRLPGVTAGPNPPTLDDFKVLTRPVLVVRGGESDVFDADAAERFVSALPNGRLETVPRTGHNVHSGNTPGFLEAIGPFLAELAEGSDRAS